MFVLKEPVSDSVFQCTRNWRHGTNEESSDVSSEDFNIINIANEHYLIWPMQCLLVFPAHI